MIKKVYIIWAFMAYQSNQELPKQVKNNLPEHAKSIWGKAFNNAEEQYKDPEKRRDRSEGADTVAAKVTWDAVKEAGYTKSKETGEWIKTKK